MFPRLAAALALTILMTLCLSGGAALAGSLPATVTDLAGRSVSVPKQVNRIILGEGRIAVALAILDPADPLKGVVGAMGEFPLLDPTGYALWAEKFPAIKDIPAVGKASATSFSVEQALSLRPDLAILTLAGHGPTPKDEEVIRQLEAAGVTVAFIDFFLDPLVNTPKSIALLGALLGKPTEADAFVSTYQAELRRVTDRLTATTPRPLVFLENRVGLQGDCCASIGQGVLATMIEAAGGRNLATGLIPGQSGLISLEYLLTHQPDVYVGTAIGNAATAGKMPDRIVLGHGVSAAVAQASLTHSLSRTGISTLTAVQQGRAHALWHHFVHSPFNVVAVQALAQWIHPDLFRDLDPADTLRRMTTRFQPMPLNGTYWTSAP
ncbi:ABC transporter substrate-binding protein [Novispirillum itersonii]|uniref:Iron complex transport system substrate-binding protein n=1 Tax=Novispirillum itersonii TaxID=189 RepID=A0A7W9ZFS5_NOVIT|nr:ABC transporter substrate-binding protein [Novispirillum itersonii]MBB6210653.1 iron complex transport system substrate-binding protein [Novispirillum itersonii]